jgi:hypothetical protein
MSLKKLFKIKYLQNFHNPEEAQRIPATTLPGAHLIPEYAALLPGYASLRGVAR